MVDCAEAVLGQAQIRSPDAIRAAALRRVFTDVSFPHVIFSLNLRCSIPKCL